MFTDFTQADDDDWAPALSFRGSTSFLANSDSNTIVENMFMTPVFAKKVRLFGFSYDSRGYPAVRWDFYACGKS